MITCVKAVVVGMYWFPVADTVGQGSICGCAVRVDTDVNRQAWAVKQTDFTGDSVLLCISNKPDVALEEVHIPTGMHAYTQV